MNSYRNKLYCALLIISLQFHHFLCYSTYVAFNDVLGGMVAWLSFSSFHLPTVPIRSRVSEKKLKCVISRNDDEFPFCLLHLSSSRHYHMKGKLLTNLIFICFFFKLAFLGKAVPSVDLESNVQCCIIFNRHIIYVYTYIFYLNVYPLP